VEYLSVIQLLEEQESFTVKLLFNTLTLKVNS
jgi:hypothetical protein